MKGPLPHPAGRGVPHRGRRGGESGGDGGDGGDGGEPILLGGDILVEMNGQSMGDPAKMAEAVAALKVGDPVQLTIIRGDQTLHLEFPLVERPVLPQDVSTGRAAIPAAGRPTPPFATRRSL